MPVSSEEFRSAMARVPSAVTIVTTLDAQQEPKGFTASAVSSLSLRPPLILVCVGRSATSYPAFVGSDRFMVNFLATAHQDLALRFSTSRADKFADGELHAGELGLPALRDATARLACSTHSVYHVGDHAILVGQVEQVAIGDGEPMVYLARQFHGLRMPEPVSVS